VGVTIQFEAPKLGGIREGDVAGNPGVWRPENQELQCPRAREVQEELTDLPRN
jgi:hypothetical protein